MEKSRFASVPSFDADLTLFQSREMLSFCLVALFGIHAAMADRYGRWDSGRW